MLPVECIAILKILQEEWFKKVYKPSVFEEKNDTYLDNVHAVFKDFAIGAPCDGKERRTINNYECFRVGISFGFLASICRTHQGHILKPGDRALGYDLYGADSNDIELDKYGGLVIHEAILIKKSYEEKCQKKRGKTRSWKLKSLDMELDEYKGRAH
ncbi:uncharacterized protein LOC111299613 [Durio zibethinus]|uniref:Uncharacterized protein LOC111299613 n=1 Tax=Durio zibethinus TaxID=66656 RepID=A0A6P5ZCU9_DURZI|nr:uncharacterized protein LOC111299613 [Durio zibethinus]